MRVGLDLRAMEGDELVERACEADRLGLWAVLVNCPLVAAELATATNHVHLALLVGSGLSDATAVHPLEVAEEIAVLDHLSERRMLAISDGSTEATDHIRRLLAGHIVNETALAPPPAQTAVPVWAVADVAIITLTTELDVARQTVDEHRDDGHTHMFVDWPGDIMTLARHLVTRALTPSFPQIVADHADLIAPIPSRTHERS